MSQSSWDTMGRPPAVAGMFYPAEPAGIEAMIRQWCSDSEVEPGVWRAALIPHAGWTYSGRIATAVLRRIRLPRTIIVFCPKHHAGGAECAVAPWQRWLYPGGSVDANVALSRRLAEELPDLQLDGQSHRQEHAIEVQLPLLAHFAPDCQIVGIVIGRIDLARCQAMASSLATLLQDQLDDVLMVISSDMNHFATDTENRRLDELALRTLDQLDPQQLYRTCHEHRITMCGMLPAVIVLSALQQLKALHRAVRVGYATSADASGDTRRVVGYAGMLFD